MSSELKIIRKVLLSQTFKKDGYEYDFMSIEPDEEGMAFDIVVNVILPKKGQSYAVPVFSQNIHEILVNIWKYIDTSFSYSERILVDGKEPVDRGLFVSEDKQRQVLQKMRKEVERVEIRSALGMLGFDVYWKKPDGKFYTLDDVYINFHFFTELSKFTLNNTPVVPNMDMIDEIAGVVTELMFDSDSIRDDINNVIYDVMSDEINIMNVDDLYYQALYHTVKVDGMFVDSKYLSHYDLEPEMFK